MEENKGIYEYRVDFNPLVDAKSVRFYLLNEHRDLFPVKTFDGTSLYIPMKLPNNVIISVILIVVHDFLFKNCFVYYLGNYFREQNER